MRGGRARPLSARYTRSSPNYEGYCLRCHVHLFPDKKNKRNYKTKETTVVAHLKEEFPVVTWLCYKRIEGDAPGEGRACPWSWEVTAWSLRLMETNTTRMTAPMRIDA